MDCLICHDKIEFNDSIKVKCNHIYHQRCIFKWMRVSNTCPYCKTELYKLTKISTVQFADVVIPRNIGILLIAMFVFSGMVAQLVLTNWIT